MDTSSTVVGSCFLLVFVIFCPVTLGDNECVGMLLIAVCINNVLVRSWLAEQGPWRSWLQSPAEAGAVASLWALAPPH